MAAGGQVRQGSGPAPPKTCVVQVCWCACVCVCVGTLVCCELEDGGGAASSSTFPSRGLVVRVATETKSSEPRLLGRLVYILTFFLTFSTVALRRMVKAKG